ncbi:eukaryotic mitochondrial regulator protein-domain-containing protein [Blastocladiella britannica]|nr:eukaryotic mitochondrial regulator protein-domain-containing protein [Blastocladiella britannica]
MLLAVVRTTAARRVVPVAALSSTSMALNETEEPQQKRRKIPRHRVRGWLATEGEQYRNPPTGSPTPYVTRRGDLPFPMNPLFRPVPPMADAVREQIFREYQTAAVELADETRAVTKLADKWRVSDARLRAIVKLKAFEKSQVALGNPLQSAFQKGMERLLRVDSRATSASGARPSAVPPLDTPHVQPIRADPPYLLALDELAHFEQADALRLLGKKSSDSVATDAATANRAKSAAKKRAAAETVAPTVVPSSATRGTKLVMNLNATIQQGHVKRVFKQSLATY